MEDIVLIGYGGHAKSVADSIERMGCYRIIGYTDLTDHQSKYPYLGTDESLQAVFDNGTKNAALCIGYLGKGDLRQRLFNQAKLIGFVFPIIADPSAIISDSSTIGEGTTILKNAVINSEAVLGKCCIINTAAIIEHECKVGDYVHIAVGAVLCGQVKVEDAAFVGANATVIQNRFIPKEKIVPAGVVIR